MKDIAITLQNSCENTAEKRVVFVVSIKIASFRFDDGQSPWSRKTHFERITIDNTHLNSLFFEKGDREVGSP